MISFVNITALIILVWTSIYTMSYGVWTWKRKNRLGGFMVFLVAMTVFLLPLFTTLLLLK